MLQARRGGTSYAAADRYNLVESAYIDKSDTRDELNKVEIYGNSEPRSGLGTWCDECAYLQLEEVKGDQRGRHESKLDRKWRPIDTPRGRPEIAALIDTQLPSYLEVWVSLRPPLGARKSIFGFAVQAI